MSGDLVRVQLEGLSAIGHIEGLGRSVLTFSLTLWLVMEMYRLLVHGRADFVTPIVRVGLAFVIVGNIGTIGASLSGFAEGAGRALATESELQLFGRAFSHAVGEVYAQSTWETITNVLSLKTLIALGSCGLYLGMMIIRELVLGIAWPIVFTLVVALGLIAVPVGVLPGMGGLGGWFRNLVEVTLWPIVFQLTVSLMVSSFSGLMHEVVKIDLGLVFSPVIAGDAGGAEEAAKALGHALSVMTKFWAFCIVYCLTGLLTPFICGWLVRSAPATMLASQVARTVLSVATKGAALLSKTSVGAKLAAGHGGMGGGVGGGAGLRGEALDPALRGGLGRLFAWERGGPEDEPLDRRHHGSPRENR